MTEEQQNDIELRSDEVQDILSHMPSWMIRWGITAIFFILLIVLSISWIIKYPDVIEGQVTLTTHQAPVKLVAKSSGELKTLLVAEDEWVSKGTPVAEITSDLDQKEVSTLRQLLVDIQLVLNGDIDAIYTTPEELSLGELQKDYHHLSQQLDAYKKALKNPLYQSQLQHMNNTLLHTKRLRNLTANQSALTAREIDNLQIKYEGNTLLYNSGSMTKFDYLSFESQFLQKQKEHENHKKQVVQMDLNLENLAHDIFNMQLQHEQQLDNLKFEINQASQTISNRIESWERSYLLQAPTSGKLGYLTTMGQGEYITGGTPLFVVVPSDDSLIAHLYIGNGGIGKIKEGQLVRLKFANYPNHEYGVVWGKVQHIALMASENRYRVDVSLTEGLSTNFGIDLEFTPEMAGQGEIVVEDIRLLDRIFSNLRKLLDK